MHLISLQQTRFYMMRVSFITFYIFLLATSIGHTQNIIPRGLQKYLTENDSTLANALYLLPIASDNGDKAVSTNSSLVLDSTVDYRVTEFGGNFIVQALSKVLFEYPEDHLVIETKSTHVVPEWKYTTKVSRTLDAQGRLFRLLAENFNEWNNAWEPDSRMEITYHGNSEEDVEGFFIDMWSYDVNYWQRAITVANEYNTADQIQYSVSTLHFGEFEIVFLDQYLYDSLSQNYRMESYLIESEDTSLIGVTEHSHSSNLLISSTEYIVDELRQLRATLKTDFSYDAHHRIDSMFTYHDSMGSGSWEKMNVIQYDYDEAHGQTSVWDFIGYDHGQPIIHQRTAYVYNDNDLIHIERFLHIDLDTGEDKYISQKVYFYSDLSTSVDHPDPPYSFLHVYPNPATNYISLNLEEAYHAEIFDVMGKSWQVLNPISCQNVILDTGHLSGGIYHLVVKDKNGTHIGHFTKISTQ